MAGKDAGKDHQSPASIWYWIMNQDIGKRKWALQTALGGGVFFKECFFLLVFPFNAVVLKAQLLQRQSEP